MFWSKSATRTTVNYSIVLIVSTLLILLTVHCINSMNSINSIFNTNAIEINPIVALIGVGR